MSDILEAETRDLTPKEELSGELMNFSRNVTNLLSFNEFVTQKSLSVATACVKDLCTAETAFTLFNTIYTKNNLELRKGQMYSVMKATGAVCKLISKNQISLTPGDSSYMETFNAAKFAKDAKSLEERRIAIQNKLNRRIKHVTIMLNSDPKERVADTIRRQKNSLPTNQPCKFFPKGNCRNGTHCRFVHADSAAPCTLPAPVATRALPALPGSESFANAGRPLCTSQCMINGQLVCSPHNH